MYSEFFTLEARATSRKDETKVPLILGVQTTLLFIALLFYVARIISRTRPHWNLQWDDYLITVAVMLVCASYGITIKNITLGYGRHVEFIKLTSTSTYIKMVWVNQMLWSWGVTFIKLSVAAMLLRIQRSTVWRICMWSCIVYLVVSAVVTMSLQLTECQPVAYYWSKMTAMKGTCRSQQQVWNGVLATSITFIFSDVFFSLLPLTFIFSLRRPLRDKIALGVLMGLGLLCTVAGIRKLFYVSQVHKQKDPTWDTVEMGLWAFTESYVGIMAACIPCLRSMFENGLKKMGITFTSVVRSTAQRSATRATNVTGRHQHGDFEMLSSSAHVDSNDPLRSVDKSKDWDRTSIPESEEAIAPQYIVRKTGFTVQSEERNHW